MATVHLQPPESFNFHKPDLWSKWKQRFEQFRLASGLSTADDTRQISSLLYCMGPEAEDVLNMTGITAAQRATYAGVVRKLDEHFGVRKNVIFERAKFNTRRQLSGETSEQYILALYTLAERCNYTSREQMEQEIRDRLVVGIRDEQLSKKLQLDSALDLDKAKKLVRQTEAVQEQTKKLTGASPGDSRENPVQVDGMSGRGSHAPSKNFRRRPHQQSKQPKQSQCTRCGKKPGHPRAECPANDATCHRCSKRGHFSSQCRTKQKNVLQVRLGADSDDAAKQPTPTFDYGFLDAIGDCAERPTAWTNDILVGKHSLQFKLDTGAEVTAISYSSYRQLHGVNLAKTSKILLGPDCSNLTVEGQFTETLAYGERSSEQTVYVIHGLKSNLLGLPAIEALQLAARLNSVDSYRERIVSDYSQLFQGLGTLGEPCDIHVDPEAKPLAIFTPRRVPFPIRDKVKEELTRMESQGVISKIQDPTPWCAGMVAVPKSSGSIRICVDLKPLNQSVQRQVFPLPTVDEVLSKLSGAKLFSKLDANSGFFQIPLASSSRPLTTFITPFGRYHFNKLPFGLTSAPELFQQRMEKLLQGLDGVVCFMDDVLIYATTEEEHDQRLRSVLDRIASAGVTLNLLKCLFKQKEIKFLGLIINEEGVSPDPEKIRAIVDMPPPENIHGLRQFMGMINQLGKFSSRLSDLTKPLRELLSSKNEWCWANEQQEAFELAKKELSKPTILALYNPQFDTKISADSSSYGLGAVILQKQPDNCWKPIAYASRSLSECERRYAQVEKEALACTWATEKFTDYVLGKTFVLETDHKPLLALLGDKNLDHLPPRILRFRLRLSRYSYSVEYVPGKLLYTADTLSRHVASTSVSDEAEKSSQDVNCFINAMVSSLPASTSTLSAYRTAQAADSTCQKVIQFCQDGWPEQMPHKQLRPYWGAQHKLSIAHNILLYGSRIVVPYSMQESTIEKIHAGHLGLQKCLQRAEISVWWPGITGQLKHHIQNCRECREHATQRKEPLIPTSLPTHPWEEVGADLFQLKGTTYLLVVDYFSRYPELMKLTSTTAPCVVNALKSVFARHGIPVRLRTDNGPQFDCDEMSSFASSYNFEHSTSSPRYPQSNGEVERCVQTIKNLLKKSDDVYLSLLVYRSTPLRWCDTSPAELCMGRRLRTNLPQMPQTLIPDWSYLDKFYHAERCYKERMKKDFDKRHRVTPLPDLPKDTPVMDEFQNRREPGVVSSPADAPRSYLVDTSSGTVRRNRHHLVELPPTKEPSSSIPEPTVKSSRYKLNPGSPAVTRSRSRALRKGDVGNPDADSQEPCTGSGQ